MKYNKIKMILATMVFSATVIASLGACADQTVSAQKDVEVSADVETRTYDGGRVVTYVGGAPLDQGEVTIEGESSSLTDADAKKAELDKYYELEKLNNSEPEYEDMYETYLVDSSPMATTEAGNSGIAEAETPTGGTNAAGTAAPSSSSEFSWPWASSSDMAAEESVSYSGDYDYVGSNEKYSEIVETGFKKVKDVPLSTFSADVDTASYANVRRMITDGSSYYGIDSDAVRPEEFLNYFSYDIARPTGDAKFAVTTEVSKCPWNDKNDLLMIGMATAEIDATERPNSNIVFLLDVSGSMDEPNKLPLLIESFTKLTENLTENDRVSIVTYANGVDVLLDGARGDEKEEIIRTLNSLHAGGGTYGEGGIQRAYELAQKSFIEGGNNRVILATDGDLNIGISEPSQLEDFITEKKESGVFLSVLGFGTGNIRDDNMQTLADKGNGNYAYIDSLKEAEKVLVEEMSSTLVTVAKDVKLQIEFNSENIDSYRLIGYENRRLNDEDFDDDTKDAGEVGAGHQVIALYEVVPADVDSEDEEAIEENSEDADVANSEDAENQDELAIIKFRYKEPDESESKLAEITVDENSMTDEPSKDFRFASTVAEFSLVLANSEYKGDATLDSVRQHYEDSYDGSEYYDEYKKELYYLIRKANG